MKKRQAGRRKYHYIYKTTCNITNRYYIGMHSTDNLEDGYIGSGMKLWKSIKKYGKENHEKEILEFLPDRKSLSNREKEIVNISLINESECLNLMVGGTGFSFHSEETKKKIGIASTNRRASKETRKKLSDLWKNEDWSKKRRAALSKSYNHKAKYFHGRKHKPETKEKIGRANSIHQVGTGNSQYGTCWIYSLEEKRSKRIKKEDLDEALNQGWIKGRKQKF